MMQVLWFAAYIWGLGDHQCCSSLVRTLIRIWYASQHAFCATSTKRLAAHVWQVAASHSCAENRSSGCC